MNIKKLKLELFYLKKAFLVYKKGFKYIYNKYILAPKILKSGKVFDRPINNENLSIHILTCHRDLVMLIWSLASFYKNLKIVGQLFIHNDGSLTDGDKKKIKELFPSVEIIDSQNFEEDFAARLDKFPVIKEFRNKYPQYVLLKKIVDPYFVSDKDYRLIIDSDLLWFDSSAEIETEVLSGCNKSFMMSTDVSCPVYFKHEKFDDRLSVFNSGIVLYHKDNFDTEKFSHYLTLLDLENPENKHFIEQAGYSYSLKNLASLPRSRYIAKGRVGQGVVMRHYTSPRRVLFYTEGLDLLKKDYV